MIPVFFKCFNYHHIEDDQTHKEEMASWKRLADNRKYIQTQKITNIIITQETTKNKYPYCDSFLWLPEHAVVAPWQPDSLECEVKLALGRINTNKASGSDGIPLELFKILKDDAVKMVHSICQQIWKTQHWPRGWKRSVFIPIPKKGNAKECSNCHSIAFISHANKLMHKILQASLQQYVSWEPVDVQVGYRKGRGTRNQIVNICWSIEKAKEFQKNIYFCFSDYPKAFDCMKNETVSYSIMSDSLLPHGL